MGDKADVKQLLSFAELLLKADPKNLPPNLRDSQTKLIKFLTDLGSELARPRPNEAGRGYYLLFLS